MTNTLEISSLLALRAELADLMIRDLLGPAGGPDEVLPDMSKDSL